ncbi:MAG: hypothetical protein EON93_04635 [Burkholderiales bacterium]|nr:MAG: hypothetical protein EON93_04635 [Burkholderiales bacterium]
MIRMWVRTLLASSMLALAAPALAQDVGVCQQALLIYRQGVGEVMQKAPDVTAALQGRADLADEEAAARTKCNGIPQFYATIDVTREDIDLALGSKVPACRAAIEAAAPHVQSAFEIARSGSQNEAAGSKILAALMKARANAEAPCKDYIGVSGRILRAENMMIASGATRAN